MTTFEDQARALSKLIQNWNLIQFVSKSDLNEFSRKILNILNEDGNTEQLAGIIESELCVTFGLFKNEFDSNVLASQIVQWQNNI